LTSDKPDPDSPRRGTNLAYLPALDGVRGVATLGILGVHAGVFLTGGGFYLLDSFFALSGFLITSLLIGEWGQKGTVRLRAFWIRRARRLLPGLFVMLIGVSVLYAIFVPTGTYPTLRGDAIASLAYVANWHFILAGSNYFDRTGLTSPLIHMWSLAVEEQFYLLWPLVFLGVIKIWRSLRALLIVCIVGSLASALEMALLYNGTNNTRLYFGTDMHAQSLLVGAGLAAGVAMWSRRRQGSQAVQPDTIEPKRLGGGAWQVRTPLARTLLAVVGLAGVVGSAILYTTVNSSEPFAYRGGFLLASLATSAVLLNVACVQRSVLARVLAFRPLAYVGRISYGLYLWHYPIFSYVDRARTGLGGWPLFGVRFAPTLAFAVVSFYLVERPIRTGTFLTARRAWVLTPAAVVLVVLAVVAGTVTPAVSAPTGVSAIGSLAASPVGQPVPSAFADAPVRVLIVGDSTALTLGFGLSIASEQRKYHTTILDEGILGCGVAQRTSFANQSQQGSGLSYPCMPDPSRGRCPSGGIFARNQYATCREWPVAWRDWLAEFKPNVVVVLAGTFEVYDWEYKGHATNIASPAFAAYVKSELEKAVGVATSEGALTVLMTAPCYNHGEQPDGSPWPEDNPARVAAYNSLLKQVAAEHASDVYVQDLHASVCPGGRYTADLRGVQIRQPDGVHFAIGRGVGGDFLAPAILPYWIQLGHLQEAEAGGATIERGKPPATFSAP
jgi:peptidoglycan/LPS O-acetylase OafA/YrhL